MDQLVSFFFGRKDISEIVKETITRARFSMSGGSRVRYGRLGAVGTGVGVGAIFVQLSEVRWNGIIYTL